MYLYLNMFIIHVSLNIFTFQFEMNHKKKIELNLLQISRWNSDQPFSHKGIWAYIRFIVRRKLFPEPAQVQPKMEDNCQVSTIFRFKLPPWKYY